MTLRATCLVGEELLPCRWIARHRGAFRLSLKHAKIFDQSFYRRCIQTAERWHAVGRNSVGDDLRQRSVGAILSLRRRGDVGSALAASTIESVTAGASIFEGLTRRDRTLILRWVTLRDRCTFDGEDQRATNDGNQNVSEPFESVRSRRMSRSHEHNFFRTRKLSDRTRLLTS